MFFEDRYQAGRLLAEALLEFRDRPEVLVLALPRGGVPVAREVARALRAPLDVLVVRKVGVPWNPEFALGAVASGGALVLNERAAEQLDISRDELAQLVAVQQQEVARREHTFRGPRPPLQLTDRTVLLVDDGLATGSTMRAAVQAARQLGASWIVVAVPVAPPETLATLKREADQVVCLDSPEFFYAVGAFYADFTQVSDREVSLLLASQPMEMKR
ncbi:MAG: phosphoribosyltransferase [Candidatus Xenobia bacterium]